LLPQHCGVASYQLASAAARGPRAHGAAAIQSAAEAARNFLFMLPVEEGRKRTYRTGLHPPQALNAQQ
jgi:hypothetical protein